MLPRARALAALLVALGALATLVLGLLPVGARWPARLALLFALPLAASVAATLLLPREPGREGASVRVAGTAHFHALVAAAVLLDRAPFLAAWALGAGSVIRAGGSQPALRLLLAVLALPLTIAAATLGSEWALRARLWESLARAGRRREAALASCVAGAALALPALLPGFVAASAPAALATLGTVVAREATAIALFRRGGLFVVGAWRGTLVALEAFVVADAGAYWAPYARFLGGGAAFHLLRVAGPLAALAVVAAVARRAPEPR